MNVSKFKLRYRCSAILHEIIACMRAMKKLAIPFWTCPGRNPDENSVSLDGKDRIKAWHVRAPIRGWYDVIWLSIRVIKRESISFPATFNRCSLDSETSHANPYAAYRAQIVLSVERCPIGKPGWKACSSSSRHPSHGRVETSFPSIRRFVSHEDGRRGCSKNRGRRRDNFLRATIFPFASVSLSAPLEDASVTVRTSAEGTVAALRTVAARARHTFGPLDGPLRRVQ